MSDDDFLQMAPDDLERFLVRRARADGAPLGARDKALARIGAATGVAAAGLAIPSLGRGAVAASLGKASGAAPLVIASKWVAIGVTAGALALGAGQGVAHWRRAKEPQVAHVSRPERPSPPSATKANPPAFTDPPIAPSPPLLVPQPEPPSIPKAVKEPAESARPAIEANPSISEPAKASAPPSQLAEPANRASQLPRELAALDEARRSVREHAGADAMAALDAYRRDFPSGSLRLEADALRIEALIELGRRDEARTLARAFLSTYPQSPAAVRVKTLVEALDRDGRTP